MEVVQVSEQDMELPELDPALAAPPDAGFIGSRIHQWSKFCRHGKAMFAWHTLCFLVDTSAVAVAFVYGWYISLVPWPFVLPAFTYCLVDVVCIFAYLVFGPVRSAPFVQSIGPLQALQQIYYTLAPVFLPTSQKPFSRVWPAFFACSALATSGRTIATIANTNLSDPKFRHFEIFRHGLVGGAIAAIRTLDSMTDLQVGALLVHQAREATCFWKGQESSCSRVMWMAVAQIVMAIVDYVIGMYLQFNNMKLDAEISVTATKLAVHLTMLLCEVGMMCIYIVSTIYLQTEDEGTEDSTPGTAQSNGRSTAYAATFIAISLCLTGIVFFANLYGVGRMMMGLVRASSKVRTTLLRFQPQGL